jgi:probable rRNA maturation factor
VAFVNNATIRQLNRRYRGRDTVTDVLSFSEQDVRIATPHGASLGEIVIAYPRARRQAAENNHSVQAEIATLLIHGWLHLVGYDHQSNQQSQPMERQAKKIWRILQQSKIISL